MNIPDRLARIIDDLDEVIAVALRNPRDLDQYRPLVGTAMCRAQLAGSVMMQREKAGMPAERGPPDTTNVISFHSPVRQPSEVVS